MNWIKKKLSEILTQRKEIVNLEKHKEYKLVKITNKGEVILRQKKKGYQISSDKALLTKTGDFIYSRLAINTGAYGIVPPELNNAIITNEMPSFMINEKLIKPKILLDMLNDPNFKWQLSQLTKGMGRIRIKESKFLKLDINYTKIENQEKLENKISHLKLINSKIQNNFELQINLLKSLNHKVLEEAISGNLTKIWRQKNPNVEISSKIIEKIGRFKKFEDIKDIEKWFDIPKKWKWCRFGEYALFERGKFSVRPRNDPTCFGGKHPFIQIGSLDENGKLIRSFKQTLNEKGLSVSKKFEKGTIVIAIVGGTIGNIGILDIDMCFPDSIVGVRPSVNTNQEYILTLIKFLQPNIKKAAYQRAGQPNISLPDLNNLLIPLPPEDEQKEILLKLNQIKDILNNLQNDIFKNKLNIEDLIPRTLDDLLFYKKVS